MDYPAVEKTYTHVNTRFSQRDSVADTENSSPSSSFSHHQPFELPQAPLTPVATQTSRPPLSRNISRWSTHDTSRTSDPAFEVDWEDGDPQNPRNWPMWYKCVMLFFISTSTLVVVLYSTAYTSAIGTIVEEFHSDKATVTLGLTTYLIGLAVGSVLFAPISETYGRKPVYIVTMFIFVVLVIPCARAKNVTTFIVVRFFAAVAGSSTISNAPGSISDVISDDYRAVAFSVWCIGPMNGPVFGPLLGGFVTEYLGWRWLHWIILIFGAVAFCMLLSIKETYSPVLLQAKAKKLRKETGDSRYWSEFDVKVGFWELMKVNLSRPFVMAVTEPICIFWNVYIGIVYGILYLCFASYPIVFHEQRGWSTGLTSLSFVGIGVGIMITICCASPIRKMINSHKPDETGEVPPESMMSVVCIASILVPLGELWFAWTCSPTSIYPAIPIAAGIPFGAGNAGIFIYASNYLVGSYGIYAASALAGNSVIRSVLGGVLPLAGAPLYNALGPNWAGTLLGLLEVIIIPVPFIFYRYGHKIRQKSTLIRKMKELEEKQEKRRKRSEQRAARAAAEVVVSTTVIDEKGLEIVNENLDDNGKNKPGFKVDQMTEEQEIAAELSRVRGLAQETHEHV